MKKVIIAIVIVIILAVGGILIFGGSSKPSKSSGSGNASTVAAVNNAVVITKTNSSVGQYLAAPSGRTLYAHNADTAGQSNCSGSCLTAWPPYQDTGSTANLPSDISTIKRTDNGETQYTYNGLPLYYFAGEAAGQVTGNGVENFSVAKPAAMTSSSSTTSPSSSSTSSSSSSSSSYPY